MVSTAIERWLQRPAVQRAAAIFFNAAGVAGAVFAAAMLVRTGTEPKYYRVGGTLAEVMAVVDVVSLITTVIVAGGMGLVLAIRGHRHALPRSLALACAAVSALFGIKMGVSATTALIDPVNHMDLIGAVALATSVLIASAMLFGSYGVYHFLTIYPKPVRLLRSEVKADGSLPRARLTTGWSWSWLKSPQLAALLTGLVFIWLLGHAIDLTTGRTNSSMAYYIACWLPFAVISAKQPLLGEDDRRAVRWVFLGQTVWLVLFLVSLVIAYALIQGNVLRFPTWNHSSVFAAGFFSFFFAGFVVVLLATLAISIFHHGTFDPDLVIRRTWVAAAVGLVFGGLFVMLERLLAEALSNWLGVSTANALTIVAALTAGVVYPVRAGLERQIRGWIERWRAAQSIADGVRKQAVIVFADLSGYTALTERNEREALIMAAVFHRDAQDIAAAHDGTLVKTIGDAVLLRFPEASRAFQAMRELKARFAGHIAAMGIAPLPIHAGIHCGEVVEGPNGDVFGSTVNIAARLLGTAGPDEIVASRVAIEAAQDAAQAKFVGAKKLKNVENPVDCFLLAVQA